MRTIAILFISSFLIFCSKQDEIEINAYPGFELLAAKNWILVKQQGIDTSVGYFHNLSDTIRFDFGTLAFGSLDDRKEGPNNLYFEKTKINGDDAIIFKGKNEYGSFLSAFIDMKDGVHKNHLYTLNPTDDARIISIFKSHKFNK